MFGEFGIQRLARTRLLQKRLKHRRQFFFVALSAGALFGGLFTVAAFQVFADFGIMVCCAQFGEALEAVGLHVLLDFGEVFLGQAKPSFGKHGIAADHQVHVNVRCLGMDHAHGQLLRRAMVEVAHGEFAKRRDLLLLCGRRIRL